jgi:hypothetical protein
MARLSQTFAKTSVALATILLGGCLSHGPIRVENSAGQGNDCGCADGSGDRCRHGFHLLDHLHADESAQQGEAPPLVAPISNFFPVPTRPVFTPWVENPPAEEISGPLAWTRSPGQPREDGAADARREPAGIPIARRVLPPPAVLPEDRRPPNSGPSAYYDSASRY